VTRGAATPVLLALLASACGSKGAVAITASIEQPRANVVASALARTLEGEFKLHLELGSYAPEGTDVSVQQVSLVKATDQTTLVTLKVTATPPPPYHLEPGSALDSGFVIADSPLQLITAEQYTAICGARTVQIFASLSDTATRKSTPVSSTTFDVTGCQ
jgi:hypothetical protein